MSSSIITSLTPNQVNDELNKMQQFIKKEAEEKAREIQLKADQEYEIEKTSIVRTETGNIDANFEDKLKKASLRQQITKSTVANRSRLRILAQREQSLNEIFDVAKSRLKQIASNESGEYRSILKALILEAMLKLLEPAVVARVREQDVEMAESLIGELVEEYKNIAKRDVEISVAHENYLNREGAGGVLLTNASGKIELDNTMEERLHLLSQEALPAIRLEMFGVSKTRKFFD